MTFNCGDAYECHAGMCNCNKMTVDISGYGIVTVNTKDVYDKVYRPEFMEREDVKADIEAAIGKDMFALHHMNTFEMFIIWLDVFGYRKEIIK